MKSDKIIIVGGGSAGWMSAATLIHFFPNKDITVVESPDYPISGVGESTLAGIRPWMFALGIKEREFMKYCDASYKQSIKFVDFYKQNDGGFHNPLGHPTYEKKFLGLNDWQLKKHYYPDTPRQDYCRTFYSMIPCVEDNKLHTGNQLENYKFERDTAYHFDGVKFGLYLRDHYCIPRGVKHIQATISSIDVGEDGVERLFLNDERFLFADLYIDCTGSKAILLNKLEEPFISYNDIIPNNRAWATKIPYKNKKEELEPYTTCTALGHGWVWNIPLWSRIGTGYVYDDTSISPEQALEDFKEYLGDRSDVEYKDIKMRVGIHERTWVKNVVGIGMAAGFIEPLQSSGLYTVHEFLLKLVRALNRDEYNQWDRDVYNTSTRNMFDRFAHFVAFHYTLSLRTDTEYWKNIHNKTFDEKMVLQQPTVSSQFFDLMRRQTQVEDHPPVGVHCICAGMDYRMVDPVTVSEWNWNFPEVDMKKMIDNFIMLNSSMRSRWQKVADNSPTVYDYLKEHIYGND